MQFIPTPITDQRFGGHLCQPYVPCSLCVSGDAAFSFPFILFSPLFPLKAMPMAKVNLERERVGDAISIHVACEREERVRE